MSTAVFILVLLGIYCLLVFPVFVIGGRRGLQSLWAAFVTLLGVWIVRRQSMGRSGCWFYAFTLQRERVGFAPA
jgi:hypothetical protein